MPQSKKEMLREMARALREDDEAEDVEAPPHVQTKLETAENRAQIVSSGVQYVDDGASYARKSFSPMLDTKGLAFTTVEGAVQALGVTAFACWVLDVVVSTVSMRKTAKHIDVLEKNLKLEGMYDRGEDGDDGRAVVVEAIRYCIRKKKRKLARTGLSAVPIASTLGDAYSAGKSLNKRHNNSRGNKRRRHAEVLWQQATKDSPDELAYLACREPLGKKAFAELLEHNRTSGHSVLKKKMRSV